MEKTMIQQRVGVGLAVLGSLIAFIVASGKSIEANSAIFMIMATAVFLLGGLCYWVLTGSNIKKQVGLGLFINGMGFWGIGWLLILLLNPMVGWWVYIAGWLALSLGFIIYGAEEARSRRLPNWMSAILLLGLLPVAAEIASPYRFAEQLHSGQQLLVMLTFSFGWIMIGYILKSYPIKVQQLEKVPATLIPQTNK